MSAALAYVHGLALVHRDLKPLNIFVTRTDTLKLGDFGLARLKASDRMSKVGTPCYRERTPRKGCVWARARRGAVMHVRLGGADAVCLTQLLQR